MADRDLSQVLIDKRKELNQLIQEGKNVTEDERKAVAALEKQISAMEKTQKRRLAAEKGISDLIDKQTVSFSSQQAELSSISGVYSKLVSKQREGLGNSQFVLGTMIRTTDVSREQAQFINQTVGEVSELTKLQQKLAESGPEELEVQQSIRDQYEAKLAEMANSILEQQKIGAITEEQAIALALMLDEQKESYKIANQYATVSKEQKEIIEKQIQAYKGIEKSIRGVLGTAKLLFSGWRGFVGTTLIGAGAALDKIGETVKSMGGYMGGVTLSTTALGVVFKDANQTAEALNRELGGMQDVTFGTQLNTNLMAMNMGISGDEAATLTANFARLNGNSTSIAADMAASTKALAKQKGVMPSAVMKDVAKSAKAFAEYGKDGGKNIAEAAVAAARLGVNMDSMTKVTDSLLDFEESINNELELGAMLGKNVNLNRARALAFEGEIGAAVKESLRALGGQAAYEKMNVFQKRQAAKTLGLSVEEMDKMVKNQEKLNDDGTLQLTTFEKIQESLTAFATTGLGSALKGMGAMVIAAGQLSTGLGALGIDMKGIVQSSFGFVKNMLKAAAVKIAGVFGKKLDFGGKKPEADLPGTDKTEKAADSVAQKGVGDKLKDLAKGLKAMGDGKVLFGALNLIPTGLGFLAMLPGLPSLFFLSKMNVSGVGKGLEDMAKGLKKMGDGKVFLGSLALVIAGGAFALLTVGALGMAAIAFLGVPTGVGLTALGKGLKSFGSNALQGVLVLGLLAGVIALSALAFGMFAGIDWNAVIYGGIALAAFAIGAMIIGKFASQIIVGALAIGLLGIALIPFAFAMSLLAGLSMESVVAAAAGLVLFAGAVIALGAIMFSGVGALVFGAGILALIALGLALLVLGTGITVLANGLNALGSSLAPVAASISTIMSSLGGMVAIIAPIALLSLALFGLASALIFLGSAGLIALPGIAALAAIQAITIGLADMLGIGGGGEGESKEDAQAAQMDALISEIKGLRADMQAGKIAVSMDGTKVTSKVSSVVDKQTGNSFRHN